MTMIIAGIDVGGTFTDIILISLETGTQTIHKVASTPESQDQAVIQGLLEICKNEEINTTDIGLVVHGTTVATNAMIQRSGARAYLVTTKGFEDIIEIGRQNRREIYSLVADRPIPLVQQDDRIGIQERVDFRGEILIPISDEDIKQLRTEIESKNVSSLAISLLFSFKNPTHEHILLEELRNIPDLYCVASCDVLPEFREYERTSTTVLEAYLGPLVVGYIERLQKRLQDEFPKSKLTLMQSNGGSLLSTRVKGRAVGLAISGLAGGVIGGWEIAKEKSIRKCITLDMGGTSCDISAIIENVRVQPDNEIAGFPLRIPSVDVKTIGAGGGSIAWLDEVGILHVGPQSAGAEPGPASYSKGGVDATVTDANIVLGRINPDYFVGGNMQLDRTLAEQAVGLLGERLGLSLQETALGIMQISTSNMVQAIREVTIERGYDPREFVLIPFGGAGPTQGVDIAEMLGIEQLLITEYPGITSAQGLVRAKSRVDLMRTLLTQSADEVDNRLSEEFHQLTAEASELLQSQGVERETITYQWKIDMRYRGQSHEISVPIAFNDDKIAKPSRNKFEELHKERYGYNIPDRDVEWVTARVIAISESKLEIIHQQRASQAGWPIDTREVIQSDGKVVLADVYRRERLAPTQQIEGAALIEQLDTTIYIPPKWIGEQNADGTMWIRRDNND